jgi:hypothetical protein
MTRAILVAVVLGSGLARAQVGPPPQAPDLNRDTPADRAASDLYEEALRANAEGKRLIAGQLANEALDVSPNGRYAASIRRFIDRLTTETLLEQPAPNPSSPIGSRVAYVLSGGLLGAIAGTAGGFGLSIETTYDTTSFNGSVIAAMALVGTTIGIAATLLSMGAVNDGSVPAQMWTGATFAAWLATATLLMTQSPDTGVFSAIYSTGIAAGAVAGTLIGAATSLTGGDGLAGLVLGNLLILDGLAFESSGGSSAALGASILVLSTLGYLGGELLNTQIHWSSGRWGLILLSTVLGAALGAVIGVAANVSNATPAVVAVGSLVGFGGGCLATLWMNPEGPPGVPPPPSEARSLSARPMGPQAVLSLAF